MKVYGILYNKLQTEAASCSGIGTANFIANIIGMSYGIMYCSNLSSFTPFMELTYFLKDVSFGWIMNVSLLKSIVSAIGLLAS